MFFFKQYLITLAFIVIAVWIKPAATEDFPNQDLIKSKD